MTGPAPGPSTRVSRASPQGCRTGAGPITATTAESGPYPNSADLPPLKRLGAKPKLIPYLQDVWSRREYLREVPASELRGRHLDSFLGNLWQVLNPLLLLGVYYLVFGLGLRGNRGIDNYITFLAIGIFTFGLIQRSTVKAAKSIASNVTMLRSLRFPRLILPLTDVLTEMMAYIAPMTVMLAIAVVTGVTPSLWWLTLIPILALTCCFNVGAAGFTARVGANVRDIDNVLTIGFRLAFYLSGILYSVDNQFSNATVKRLFELNPFYAIITCARGAVFGQPAPAALWISATVWSISLLVGGVAFFKAAEHTYGRG